MENRDQNDLSHESDSLMSGGGNKHMMGGTAKLSHYSCSKNLVSVNGFGYTA